MLLCVCVWCRAVDTFVQHMGTSGSWVVWYRSTGICMQMHACMYVCKLAPGVSPLWGTCIHAPPSRLFCPFLCVCVCICVAIIRDGGNSSNEQQQQQSPSKRHSSGGGGGSGGGPLDFGSALRRCTDSLLVLNALLFVANWASKDVLMLWGAKVNSLIAAGQLWRLVTCNVLHTNMLHFLVRMCDDGDDGDDDDDGDDGDVESGGGEGGRRGRKRWHVAGRVRP